MIEVKGEGGGDVEGEILVGEKRQGGIFQGICPDVFHSTFCRSEGEGISVVCYCGYSEF